MCTQARTTNYSNLAGCLAKFCRRGRTPQRRALVSISANMSDSAPTLAHAGLELHNISFMFLFFAAPPGWHKIRRSASPTRGQPGDRPTNPPASIQHGREQVSMAVSLPWQDWPLSLGPYICRLGPGALIEHRPAAPQSGAIFITLTLGQQPSIALALQSFFQTFGELLP